MNADYFFGEYKEEFFDRMNRIFRIVFLFWGAKGWGIIGDKIGKS
jgi:hypothetical protein